MDCVFCKIVEGELPIYKIYEDESFLAFLSISPLSLGHTLVIPKKHYRWVWDVSATDAPASIGKYYELSSKIANAMKRAFGIEQVMSFVFGEEVPHAHIWLVPVHAGDNFSKKIDLVNTKEFSEEEMKEAAEKINKELIK